MGTEIERKYLVAGDAWRTLGEGMTFRQGYLSTVKERTVRVRVVGDVGTLTIKGLTVGTTRAEYEYPIPVDDVNQMLDTLCEQPVIDKTRFIVEHDFIMATYLADRVIVFEGTPSIKTKACSPQSLLTGMNKFLKQLQITFRRDPNNFR